MIGWAFYRYIKGQHGLQPDDARRSFPVRLVSKKYYIDELYNVVFIQPALWFSEVFVSQWMDKGAIDGILHIFGPITGGIGYAIRNWFDVPFVNKFIGDGSADVTYWFGKNLRPIQTGRIQQYLLLSLIILFVIGGLLYALLVRSA